MIHQVPEVVGLHKDRRNRQDRRDAFDWGYDHDVGLSQQGPQVVDLRADPRESRQSRQEAWGGHHDLPGP